MPDLILVGGGHAHVQVLRSFAMAPIAARVTLIIDDPVAIYSGMVPGYVEGVYSSDDIAIDVHPLARRAGATVIHSRVLGFDPSAKTLALAGRPPVTYDVVSFNIGATVRGLDSPGVREHAIATRPIRALVDELGRRLSQHAAVDLASALSVVVVGAGVAGVELACAVDARLGARPHRVTLVSGAASILPDASSGLRRKALAALSDRDIRCVVDRKAVKVTADAVILDDAQTLAADIVVLATGAAPGQVFDGAGLASDPAGYPLVRDSLQLRDHDDAFAVGDCAAMERYPKLPKAGVYAVRQGPVLADNLRAWVAGRRLRAYRPQRDMLVILSLGGREAIAGKWWLTWRGAMAWQLKDWIDRRFIAKFQVLDPHGNPTEGAGTLGAMGESPDDASAMMCGGCAAKVGQVDLQRALGRLPPTPPDPTVRLGLGTPDDAAVVQLPGGDQLAISVDGFRAFSDDAWLTGRVAASNAVSDLYATGVSPRYALAMVTLPAQPPRRAGVLGRAQDRTAERLYQVMAGARATLDPLGVTLLGGHTTVGPELVVGFSVHGTLPADGRLLTKAGMVAGDALVLSHPLGTGALLAADMRGEAAGRWIGPLYRQLMATHAGSAQVTANAAVHAGTDVTGFGLAGHLIEMVRASGVSARIAISALPILPGAVEVTGRGVRSTIFEANVAAVIADLNIASGAQDHPALDLLFDPQTSGGLLLSVAPEVAQAVVSQLISSGAEAACVVGSVTHREAAAITVFHPDRD